MEKLHAQPNARIIAARIVAQCADAFTPNERNLAIGHLEKALPDNTSNLISGELECEEDEARVTAGMAAADSLLALGYETTLEGVYAKAIDRKIVRARSMQEPRVKGLIWKVDENDCQIGFITRTEAEQKGIPHRTVHVYIFPDDDTTFNQDNRITVQLRSAQAGSPGSCQTASGHVDYGESYPEAAIAEISEELFSGKPVPEGLRSTLKLQCVFRYEIKDARRHNREWSALFTARHNGSFKPDAQEVAGLRTLKIGELLKDVQNHPESYTASFKRDLKFLQAHYAQ